MGVDAEVIEQRTETETTPEVVGFTTEAV